MVAGINKYMATPRCNLNYTEIIWSSPSCTGHMARDLGYFYTGMINYYVMTQLMGPIPYYINNAVHVLMYVALENLPITPYSCILTCMC